MTTPAERDAYLAAYESMREELEAFVLRNERAEIWCSKCDQPSVVEVKVSDSITIALCGLHAPCDDCGQIEGHCDDIEH